jgi:hydrogenase maturation protease
MNLERVEKIAEAVLYEGYMLYPYRASAIKNQQRWNFGVLCPRSYSVLQNGSEAWVMHTECLLQSGPSVCLNVKIRFLQIVSRSVGRLIHLLHELPEGTEPEFELVDRLEVNSQTFVPWQEAVEREIAVPPMHAASTSLHPPLLFEFPSGRAFEPLRNEEGLIAGIILREQETLSGSVEIDSKQSPDGAIKVTVRIHNLTRYEPSLHQSRADALMYSLVSTHTILALEDGQFISMLDPPENLRSQVEECHNLGTWPVLVGDEGDRDTMLSSPIILYDYPQIAPESPGGLFDGTEIDEILSLRILTMTDEEKSEMRQSDQRARQILERTENMPPEQFMKLHGALRGLRSLTKEAS